MAWAVERMCEDHLYFAMLDMRWLDTANFKKGLGRHMFGPIPAPARPLVKCIGRHTRQQIAELAIRDIDSLAVIIGNKPFLMGQRPCAADGFVFGIVTSILTPPLDSPIRAAIQKHANLVAYRDRVTSQYFSDQVVAKGGQAHIAGVRQPVHSQQGLRA
jgi:glutathione S-transferase